MINLDANHLANFVAISKWIIVSIYVILSRNQKNMKYQEIIENIRTRMGIDTLNPMQEAAMASRASDMMICLRQEAARQSLLHQP